MAYTRLMRLYYRKEAPIPADARKRECRRVLERWKAHYHDEAELRALAKSPTCGGSSST